ncbi:hypothetical protein ACH5RR_014484 [Cinchona calisaya]|uniref:Small ribosomal subunit protein mS38 n=1 Tax=Cinchona calisaya TaxID=153742 RepID=A0ABD3A6M0_9GENT
MGWSVFPKLLRIQSQSTSRIILLHLNKSTLSHPHLPPLPPSTSTGAAAGATTSQFLTPPSDIQPQIGDWSLNHSPSSQKFFPSFSFGFFLNPNSSSGFIKTDVDGCGSEEEDSRTIWADSVKKKRKRKMNKHKLRKLRKRLRRKT